MNESKKTNLLKNIREFTLGKLNTILNYSQVQFAIFSEKMCISPLSMIDQTEVPRVQLVIGNAT